MQLQEFPPKSPELFPSHPQPHPLSQPQFVAAKSLIYKSSKFFDYTPSYVSERKWVTFHRKVFGDLQNERKCFGGRNTRQRKMNIV